MCAEPRETADRESGFALVGALLAVIVISGVVVVMMATAQAELRFTAGHRSFEGSAHAAEGAVDVVAERVQADRMYVTGHAWTLPAAASPADERAWAVAAFDAAVAAGSPALLATPDGPSLGIRPHHPVDGPMDVIFGVASAGDGARGPRVVKVAFDRAYFTPDAAILTEGDLMISGNPDVLGISGHIHSNSALTVSGNPEASGNVTATGALNSSGSITAAGLVSGNQPRMDIPDFSPRELYGQRQAYAGSWYDLCPNGRVRAPAAVGQPPCSGTEIFNTASGTDYRGWKLSGDNWDFSSNTGYDGVYYVFGKGAKIGGNPGTPATPATMTILVEAAAAPDDGKSGNLEISGNPHLRPFLSEILSVTDRDIKLNGNPAQSFNGFFGAREQIDIGGNPVMTGSIVSLGRPHTPGSPIVNNSVSGEAIITFDGSMALPLGNRLRLSAWNEL
jgi:type II secretory pathway pseudopilin PulG